MLSVREPNFEKLDDFYGYFTADTLYLFKKLIIKQIDGEEEAEYLKQYLNQRPLFSVYDAFLTLDQNDKGFIT